MNIQFRYNILVLMTLGVMSTSFAQNQVTTVKNKHHVSATFSYYYFYDSTPITQLSHLSTRSSSSRSIGLSYANTIDEKNGWSTSIDYYSFVSQKEPHLEEAGEVKRRLFFLFQGHYRRTIFTNTKGYITGTAGLSFRSGEGSTLVSYIFVDGQIVESFRLGRTLLDIGVPVGVEATRYLGEHFHLRTRLSHTFFPYVFEKKDPNYGWDKGSPRNMTSLTFGIGFNF